MRGFFLSFLVFLSVATQAGTQKFPLGPDPRETQGSLCNQPSEYRYPERIPYCRRNVMTETKYQVIDVYERQLGYKILSYGREKFKIDHLIPLCMGGSNNENNLWPQHESVYKITDPLEFAACEKMKAGRLSQKEAVDIILAAKNDLSHAGDYMRAIEAK